MIKDLVVGFEKAQIKYPSIIQDNYNLDKGIYIRLDVNRSWQSQSATFEKNHLIINEKENASQNIELVNWFKLRDYLSSLVGKPKVDKALDCPDKKIHSNNPFSLFVKREVFLGEKKDVTYNLGRYFPATNAESIIQKWLEIIPNINNNRCKNKDKKAEIQSLKGLPKELLFFHESEYVVVLTYLNSIERLQWIERIKQWYENNLTQLTDFVAQLSFKNYVKLFFDANSPITQEYFSCEQIYDFEYILYTIPKIYNSNDYNQIVNKKIVGLPNFDMSMNSKKPFMEHKTMRVKAPDRVILKQAILAKQAIEWLTAVQPKYKTNKIGYELGFAPPNDHSAKEGTFHVYMGKYNQLHGFENVPFPPMSSFNIEWHNILQLTDHDGDLKYYGNITNSDILQKNISSRFFRGRMTGEFILDEPEVKNKEFTVVMRALFLQGRQAFHDWFYKGTIMSMRGIFSKLTLRLLEEQLIHVDTSRRVDLADAFNLRLSIKLFINEEGGSIMADRIKDIIVSLRGKLVGEGLVVCASDEEFYFVAGQLAYYLTYQSKAEKKTGEIFEPFLRAKNGQQLKKRLEDAYMLYKHEISPSYRKFNNAFSMIMGYEPEQENENSTRELLLAGIFADNLMFQKIVKEV